MLGLPSPRRRGPFYMVRTDDDANLDYMDSQGELVRQHYPLSVGDAEFDAIFDRIRKRKLIYWADPARQKPTEINKHDGGRDLYFEDLNGHLLEIITRPYGSGGALPTPHCKSPSFSVGSVELRECAVRRTDAFHLRQQQPLVRTRLPSLALGKFGRVRAPNRRRRAPSGLLLTLALTRFFLISRCTRRAHAAF